MLQGGAPLSPDGRKAGPASDVRTISVTVTGEVEREGMLKLIEGTTLKGLFEAVRPKSNAYIDHADYAYVLQDGDEVHIPANIRKTPGRVSLSDESLLRIRVRSTAAPREPAGSSADRAGSTKAPLININRASTETLQTLPRIGPEMADRIISDRNTRGPFKTKQDLLRVRGVGRKTYQWLEPLISVE